jgi:hypothetical protein
MLGQVAFAGEIYGCGQYEVAGTLRSRGNGIHALEIYPGNKNHFDLVLHGLPLSNTIAYKDRRVHFKVFIYRAGGVGVARARFIGPIHSATPQQITSDPMQLQKSEACSIEPLQKRQVSLSSLGLTFDAVLNQKAESHLFGRGLTLTQL